ncbi:hypothetical protein [Geomobilimonas luticola]|uniref:DUF4440 domain-containing protein n=1 Tax=Geomobilimonas luticola TaxID=1114878 RepID=A0ABS5S9V6_9BACT|nr:hypothetical protein [Geomobilimonas luticola]MBT0652159.1 hypothetical protein [Geomobilimonas luticola]
MTAPKLLADQVDDEIAARQGFEEILDLWRGEEFELLSLRVTPSDGSRGYFLERMVYASRVPACCWEKLQDVKVTWQGEGRVSLAARVGLEAEGFGVRFVNHVFSLVREHGVWKVPAVDILTLAAPNPQRVPRKIPLRQE